VKVCLNLLYTYWYTIEIEAMIIGIQRDNDEPVYEQIARQIRHFIAKRELMPGTSLPTVRILASDLGVTLNTVARAYWILEEQGFVRIRDRSGVEVAAPSRRSAADLQRLRQELASLLARMKQAGLGRDELQRIFEKEVS
jgi:GntR family transcriptional regulator